MLLVEELGKEISGTGMDTTVIGRRGIPGEPDPPRPRIATVVVLDVTPASHGNAIGVGGTLGAILTGVFADPSINEVGKGLLYGNPGQLWTQIVAVLATLGFTVAHIFNARYQRGAALAALAQVLRGALAPHFVWGNLVLGLMLPSAALVLHLTGILVAVSLPWTGALILLGSLLAKYAVIKAGHYAPLF